LRAQRKKEKEYPPLFILLKGGELRGGVGEAQGKQRYT
jgi:hypothetical protein